MSTAAPRFNGKLVKWNADRGFGFLVADHGDQELFVHVSAFPRGGHAPVIGELLSFEMELDKEGRKRAVRLRRAGATPADMSRRQPREPQHALSRREPEPSRAGRWATVVVALLVAAGVGWLGYSSRLERAEVIPLAEQLPTAIGRPAPNVVPDSPLPAFQCDGRKHCSQMTSCREATQFLRNCPGMEMDGDGDGVPCEQQWCTGPGG